MSWQAVAQAPGSTNSGLFDGGFSWGLLIIGIVAVLALTAVCTFGILARVRDRAADEKSLASLHRQAQPTDGAPAQRGDTGGNAPATG